MPKTSTAARHNHVCPLCDQPLGQDREGLGWVRHTERPDVPRILADPEKRRMMDEEAVQFLTFHGICPFELGEKDDVSPPPPRFEHLGPWQGSNYRQWFYKNKKIRAETLYRATVGDEPRTPEEVAEDYDVPVEAVREAIEYCLYNEGLLRREREEDLADMRARGFLRPPLVPAENLPER